MDKRERWRSEGEWLGKRRNAPYQVKEGVEMMSSFEGKPQVQTLVENLKVNNSARKAERCHIKRYEWQLINTKVWTLLRVMLPRRMHYWYRFSENIGQPYSTMHYATPHEVFWTYILTPSEIVIIAKGIIARGSLNPQIVMVVSSGNLENRGGLICLLYPNSEIPWYHQKDWKRFILFFIIAKDAINNNNNNK